MRWLIASMCVVFGAAALGAEQLSREQIAAAIEQGRAGKIVEKKCKASGVNGFDMVVRGPIGRIMRAARDAQEDHREFTAGDVTPLLSRAVVTIEARRDYTLSAVHDSQPAVTGQPTQSYVLPPQSTVNSSGKGGVDYQTGFIVRSKPSGLEPIQLRPVGGILYSSADGRGPTRSVPLPGDNMTASFDLAAFRALPKGDVEVVIFMTDAGEHRCKISDTERQKIQ